MLLCRRFGWQAGNLALAEDNTGFALSHHLEELDCKEIIAKFLKKRGKESSWRQTKATKINEMVLTSICFVQIIQCYL